MGEAAPQEVPRAEEVLRMRHSPMPKRRDVISRDESLSGLQATKFMIQQELQQIEERISPRAKKKKKRKTITSEQKELMETKEKLMEDLKQIDERLRGKRSNHAGCGGEGGKRLVRSLSGSLDTGREKADVAGGAVSMATGDVKELLKPSPVGRVKASSGRKRSSTDVVAIKR